MPIPTGKDGLVLTVFATEFMPFTVKIVLVVITLNVAPTIIPFTELKVIVEPVVPAPSAGALIMVALTKLGVSATLAAIELELITKPGTEKLQKS